jgi:hypothetical protein
MWIRAIRLLALAPFVWMPASAAALGPPAMPPGLRVEGVSAGGTGCPTPDTITSIVTDDGSAFLLLFDQLQLAYPPGPATQTMTCAVDVEIQVPEGWTIGLGTVTTRGYAYLDEKIKARASSCYFLAGDKLACRPHPVLNGPFDELYEFTDKIPFGSVKWSSCGGSVSFTVETLLKLDASKRADGQALFSSDAVDGAFQQVFRWKWKKC